MSKSKQNLHLLVDVGGFFEGLRWRDGFWFASDFQRNAVMRISPTGTQERWAEVAGQPSGLGWLTDGSMLIVSMHEHRLLRRITADVLEPYADLGAYPVGHLNDMVVSAAGHAYVSAFGFDVDIGEEPRKTAVLHVSPDRKVSVAADDFFFPNGMVITPDDKTLIVGESFGGCYTAFSIAADGSLSDRRLWAALGPMPILGEPLMSQIKVTPDGCCLDADGAIWFADPINHRVVRTLEGGQITDEIPAPEGLYFWACMLGGYDGRTLLISCAPNFLAPHGNGEGQLYTTRVSVPHAGLP